MNSWERYELAIFSVKNFVFGVDAGQIREIVTTETLELLVDPDEKYPFLVIRHREKPLPLFSVAKQLGIDHASFVDTLSSPVTFVTFDRTGFLMACLVGHVEKFASAPLASLKSVPDFMIRAARKACVWGFYDMMGTLIPLIDFQQIITDQDIAFYRKLQHSL